MSPQHRRLAWRGLPAAARREAWPCLLGAAQLRRSQPQDYFEELLQREGEPKGEDEEAPLACCSLASVINRSTTHTLIQTLPLTLTLCLALTIGVPSLRKNEPLVCACSILCSCSLESWAADMAGGGEGG